MLASEIIKGYSFARISPQCMIKVDMMKAYDSLEWFFLRRMHKELAFPQIFVSWIMNCVTMVSYSSLVNGVPCKKFRATKGLRQGSVVFIFVCYFSGVLV